GGPIARWASVRPPRAGEPAARLAYPFLLVCALVGALLFWFLLAYHRGAAHRSPLPGAINGTANAAGSKSDALGQNASVSTGRAGVHPRLLVTQNDIARLRGWAVSANPIWHHLVSAANECKRLMDNGTVPRQDTGAI